MVGTIAHENEARRLAHYLTSQSIANSCEVSFDPTFGHMSYQIWVHDEDKIAQATEIFTAFQQDPSNSRFDAPIIEEPEPNLEPEPTDNPIPHRYKPRLTHFFIALCVLLFFLDTLQEIPLRKEGLSEETFMMTPIQALFVIDLPPAIDKLEKVIEKYENKPVEGLPLEVKEAIAQANNSPFWRGVYDWVVLKIQGKDTSLAEGPLFYRIRQGQIWRFFTPCLLHAGILHILFNMLWLWYLGRPIEQRIGPLRTLVLTLTTGMGANVIQYLVSGPLFIGYSGIIAGLAGFIWMREKIAPWEGYPLNKATIWFLLLFLLAIFGLQVIAFFIQIFSNYNFAPNIANTAHIMGAVIGAFLARSSFFAQRVHP
jgi:GlpG protein